MDNQLILPRKDKDGNSYISYSQIAKFKKSKREYIRQYFFGEPFEGNAYTDFGKRVGEALEENDFSSFNEDEQKFLATVPRFDQFEREIRLQMDGFYVLGFIDTNTEDDKTKYVEKLADYKTGDIEKKSAEYESDDYNQVDIYAAALEQDTGKLPEEGCVYLIGRAGNAFSGEQLFLTNEYKTIDKPINPERIATVKAEVQEIAEEISALYQVFLKLKGNE